MRGEEIQAIGLTDYSALGMKRVIPGITWQPTVNIFFLMPGDFIVFTTYMTGELFEVNRGSTPIFCQLQRKK